MIHENNDNPRNLHIHDKQTTQETRTTGCISITTAQGDYLWTILDDKKGDACYEIQLIKLEFPSSIKAVRQGRYGKAIQLN